MTPLRVAVVVETLEAWDASRAVVDTILNLPRATFQVEVCCRDDGSLGERLRAAGVPVHTVGRRPRRAWSGGDGLAQRAAAYDLAHLADEWSLRNVGPFLAWRGARYVCSVGDFRRDVAWRQARWERYVLRRAKLVVASDAAVGERRRVECGLAAEAPRWATIEEGCPPPSVAAPRIAVLTELGLPTASRLLACAAPFTAAQNLEDVVWIGMLLKILHDDLRIVLIGDGPRRAALERFIEAGEVADRTRIVSDPAQFERIAPHLSLYLDPAKWTGPSRALGAAQAVGVPVIAVDTPITRRRVAANRSGYLVAEHDRAAMTRHGHRLLSHASLWEAMSAAGREFAAKTWAVDRASAAWARVYEAAASSAGESPPSSFSGEASSAGTSSTGASAG
jgi:glycosyltransferase involved in cell wall biosynthesis